MGERVLHAGTQNTAHGDNGTETLPGYRQTLADKSVSNDISATDRIRARIALLVSYIPDAPVSDEELTAFRERIASLLRGWRIPTITALA